MIIDIFGIISLFTLRTTPLLPCGIGLGTLSLYFIGTLEETWFENLFLNFGLSRISILPLEVNLSYGLSLLASLFLFKSLVS